MYELIQWADENNVPEFTYITKDVFDEDDNIIETLKIAFGLPRNENLLLNLKELNLSGHNFTEIPEQVKYLTNLKLLNFSKDISDTEWPALQNADRFNVLTSIPNWISELINLEELNLSDNRIRYIPSELGLLKKLKKLYLHCNGVVLIHPNLAKLESLEILWLYASYLRSLPETISLLKKAKMLGKDYKASGRLLNIVPKVLTLVNDNNFDEILGVNNLLDSCSYKDTLTAYFDAFSYILDFGAKEKTLS